MKNWMMITGAVLGLQMGLARAADNQLTPAEVKDGFKLLFDGTTLQSFKDNFVDYVKGNATNNTLDSRWKLVDNTIYLADGHAPDVRSTKTYKDFDLRLTYKINENEGIFYRCLLTGNQLWETGVEYAINNRTDLGKDNPGAAYDLFAPNPLPYNLYDNSKPSSASLWNTARIVVKGDSVEHYMNEKKVVGYRYHNQRFWDAYNVSKWNTGNTLTNKTAGDRNSGYIEEGYLGLQGDHSGKWIIKDLRVSTTACLGPLNAELSACGTTVAITPEGKPKASYAVLGQSEGRLSLRFERDDIKGAAIVGLDGRDISRAALSEANHVARFENAPSRGVYFLKAETASGVVTQKLNLL